MGIVRRDELGIRKWVASWLATLVSQVALWNEGVRIGDTWAEVVHNDHRPGSSRV